MWLQSSADLGLLTVMLWWFNSKKVSGGGARVGLEHKAFSPSRIQTSPLDVVQGG